LVITFSGFAETALKASKKAGIPDSAVIVLDGPGGNNRESVSSLVALGERSPLSYKEVELKPGEAKSKIAFLSFSSGTTGVYILI
jgi:4-coumarate--CoA ligase